MKKLYFISLFLLSILVVSAKSIVLDGKIYIVDTLAHHKVGPGSQYTALRLNSDTRLDVYFVKVDGTNPYISFKAALSLDSIYGRERPSVVAGRKSKTGAVYFAGTNADFYDVANPPYYGYPLSGCVVENEVAKVPTIARRIVAFEEDKTPSIGAMSYTGNVKFGTATWTLHGVNHLRSTDQLILYNQHNGKITRTDASGTEVLVQLKEGNSWGVSKTITAKVIKIEKNKGGMPIPKGYAVLSGNGVAASNLNMLAVNDEVDITMNMEMDGRKFNITQMVGGDNRLPMLYEGKIETGTAVWNELHPRTAFGYSYDKKTIIFCVVDGRGVSVGVTTLQLAQLMKSAGAYTAFNMDGGGSSSMYIKEFGPVNDPSDGSERSVGNSLFAVSSAPDNLTVTAIQAYKPTIRIAKDASYQPKFIGYNEYGTLIYKDLQGVVLSCSSEVGTIINNNTFKATGTKDGIVTATYNGKTTQLRVDQTNNDQSNLVERISEDFSSATWDAELKRLNNNYTTLLPGTEFQNMNNVDYYFDRYAFDGAMISEPYTPNCADHDITHGDGGHAIAYRFRNSGLSFMEFPEMASAGTITVHVRNANNTAATTLTLEQYVGGNWGVIHTFNLKAKNAYSATSVDEVLSHVIGSSSPIKLRLSRGDRFISLLRVDITAFGETGLKTPPTGTLKLIGRILTAETPTHVALFNLMGVKVFETFIERETKIPVSIGNGIFLIRSADNAQKILLNT